MKSASYPEASIASQPIITFIISSQPPITLHLRHNHTYRLQRRCQTERKRGTDRASTSNPDRQIRQSFIITALPAFFLPCCDHTGSVHNETSRLQAKGSGLRFKAQQRKRKSERKNKVTTKQLEKRCICTELYYLVCIHYTRTCTRTHSTHAHIRNAHTNVATWQSRLS